MGNTNTNISSYTLGCSSIEKRNSVVYPLSSPIPNNSMLVTVSMFPTRLHVQRYSIIVMLCN